MSETSWQFLIIGSIAAVGAAMAAGTIAALVRHRRTGMMPGADEPSELTRAQQTALWIRIGLGVTVAVAGIAWIWSTGIF